MRETCSHAARTYAVPMWKGIIEVHGRGRILRNQFRLDPTLTAAKIAERFCE